MPVVVIPAGSDGVIDTQAKLTGRLVDLSATGARVELDGSGSCAFDTWIMGLAQGDASWQYVGLQLVHRLGHNGGSQRIGGCFGGSCDRMLTLKTVVPMFDPATRAFRLPYLQRVLAAWCEAGLFESVLLDRIQVCPRCKGLPTFRMGCRRCGSGRTQQEQVIHHFACAHVGPIHTFEAGDYLVCPKCRTRKLTVGADYGYVTIHRCLDCDWVETQLEQQGHCLACDHRFVADKAAQEPLIGYRRHVKRLEPSRLLGTDERAKYTREAVSVHDRDA